MKNLISIRPSKDIRNNYAQISALSKECPVAITVNGKEDTVLLSHENYLKQQAYINELEEKIEFYANLSHAMDDIRLGRIKDANLVYEDLLKDLENIDL